MEAKIQVKEGKRGWLWRIVVMHSDDGGFSRLFTAISATDSREKAIAKADTWLLAVRSDEPVDEWEDVR